MELNMTSFANLSTIDWQAEREAKKKAKNQRKFSCIVLVMRLPLMEDMEEGITSVAILDRNLELRISENWKTRRNNVWKHITGTNDPNIVKYRIARMYRNLIWTASDETGTPCSWSFDKDFYLNKTSDWGMGACQRFHREMCNCLTRRGYKWKWQASNGMNKAGLLTWEAKPSRKK